MLMKRVTFEVCIDSVEGSLAAERGGADRVELCSALSDGGLTPGIGLVQQVVQATTLPVMMMVRPRGGSFCYSASELRVMFAEIDAARKVGVIGIVFGALDERGGLDVEATEQLLLAAGSLETTFHRAIDEAREPLAILEQLMGLGFDRVLTSGKADTALEGKDRIREMVSAAGSRITVMPGAGVRPENAAEIIRATGAFEIHGTASESRPERCPLGERRMTCEKTVAAIRTVLDAECSGHR